jgi:hypothetical protein
MLRTPASLTFETIRHIQTEHWAVIAGFIVLLMTFGSAAYIGLRRLRMAKIWAGKLLERGGRTENEILTRRRTNDVSDSHVARRCAFDYLPSATGTKKLYL